MAVNNGYRSIGSRECAAHAARSVWKPPVTDHCHKMAGKSNRSLIKRFLYTFANSLARLASKLTLG